MRHPLYNDGSAHQVLLACADYERLRDQERQAHSTADLPADLAAAILQDLEHLRTPVGVVEEGDAIIG